MAAGPASARSVPAEAPPRVVAGRSFVLPWPPMSQANYLLRLFDRTFITKVLLLALLYSLLPLAEIFLLMAYVSERIGTYFTLALAASVGLVGMLLTLREFHKHLEVLTRKIRAGVHPQREFVALMGILCAGLLLLTPGFITDFVGFLLFVPALREALGRLVLRLLRIDLKEIYEYLKLGE